MDKKELVKTDQKPITLPEITAEDVKKFFCANATASEIALFLQVAKMNNLNPFKRELYLVKYGSAPATIITGYEVYLKRAEQSKEYAGFKSWTEGNAPDMKACIEVYRKGWDKPLYHEVEYSEYVGKTRDGKVTRFWDKMPKTMLKKVAISQAFRFAFPGELGGLPYTKEEMGEIIDTNVIEPSQNSTESPQGVDTMATENNYKKMLLMFEVAKKKLGEEDYYHILEKFGFKKSNEIKSIKQGNTVLKTMKDVIDMENAEGGTPNE